MIQGVETDLKPHEGRLRELERSFRVQLVRPADSTYDQNRRVWNGSIDRRPALIARCASVADVVAGLRFASDTGLAIAVRGGGHSFPGLSVCDGGVVIDMGLMKRIHVDPEKKTACAEAGVLLGELDRETQAFGLAVPAGIVTHTGLAGLTLGGGIGWLQRKYGLTVDQLLSVELVTAEGEVVEASESENSDLFWGVRGGGGNFGIVTEFRFRLNPVGPTVLAGPIFWPMERAPKVLRFYRDWVAEAPEELMTIVVLRKAPALPFVPEDLRGELVITVVCCHSGAVDDGEEIVRPLRSFASPVLDACVPKPFLDHQATFDPSFPHDWWYYMRSCDVAELNDDVIDIAVEHSLRISSPRTAFPIWQMGGAITAVGEADTAFSGRHDGHTFNITGMTDSPEGFEQEREWVRDFWSALAPHHTGVYLNFLMDEGEERVRQAYGPDKYDRLKELKRRWDPENVFRLNQNIPPG
jgi:FAD/FMN-containing dehydrogenase